MERLRFTFVRESGLPRGAAVELLGDLGTGAIDEVHPLPPGRVGLWPECVASPHLESGHLLGTHVDAAGADGHLEGAHLLHPHGMVQLAFVLESPSYVFGRFRHALCLSDGAGHTALTGELVQTVNSAPEAPTGLRLTGWDASARVLRFAFRRVRFVPLAGN